MAFGDAVCLNACVGHDLQCYVAQKGARTFLLLRFVFIDLRHALSVQSILALPAPHQVQDACWNCWSDSAVCVFSAVKFMHFCSLLPACFSSSAILSAAGSLRPALPATSPALPNVSTALSGGTSESFASEFWFAEYSSESSDTSGKAAVERCAFGH